MNSTHEYNHFCKCLDCQQFYLYYLPPEPTFTPRCKVAVFHPKTKQFVGNGKITRIEYTENEEEKARPMEWIAAVQLPKRRILVSMKNLKKQ